MLFNTPIYSASTNIIGDTHTPDIIQLLEHYNFTNACLIHVGDFGVGFYHPNKEDSFFREIQTFLEVNNNKLLVIRGNHDNPVYFNKTHQINQQYDNIELVEDYTYKTINDKSFLFVGGATSIDRQVRELYKDYWTREKFVLPDNISALVPCDILITHTSTLEEFPNDGFIKILGWFKNDPTLREELIEERKLLTELYNQVTPKLGHYYGHFHESHIRIVDGVKQQCLDINEIISLNM